MANEFPKQGDLIQERENLKSKIQAIQAQKFKDIEEKVLGIENNIGQVKNLDGLLIEARENLAYYENLREGGQLPEDELENYDKAKKLVLEIEEKMAGHNETVKKTMGISEVEGNIQEQALAENDKIEKEKQEKIKEKLVENKFSDLLDELISEAKETKEALDKLYEEWAECREKVIGPIKERFGEDFFATGRYSFDNAFDDRQEGWFKEGLEKYKRSLGKLSFSDKNFINKILSSKELVKLENKRSNYENFYKLKFSGGSYDYENVGRCARGILYGSDKYVKKYLEIRKFSSEKPYVNSKSILNKVLEGKGFEEGVLSDRDFSDIAIDYERKNKQE